MYSPPADAFLPDEHNEGEATSPEQSESQQHTSAPHGQLPTSLRIPIVENDGYAQEYRGLPLLQLDTLSLSPPDSDNALSTHHPEMLWSPVCPNRSFGSDALCEPDMEDWISEPRRQPPDFEDPTSQHSRDILTATNLPYHPHPPRLRSHTVSGPPFGNNSAHGHLPIDAGQPSSIGASRQEVPSHVPFTAPAPVPIIKPTVEHQTSPFNHFSYAAYDSSPSHPYHEPSLNANAPPLSNSSAYVDFDVYLPYYMCGTPEGSSNAPTGDYGNQLSTLSYRSDLFGDNNDQFALPSVVNLPPEPSSMSGQIMVGESLMSDPHSSTRVEETSSSPEGQCGATERATIFDESASLSRRLMAVRLLPPPDASSEILSVLSQAHNSPIPFRQRPLTGPDLYPHPVGGRGRSPGSQSPRQARRRSSPYPRPNSAARSRAGRSRSRPPSAAPSHGSRPSEFLSPYDLRGLRDRTDSQVNLRSEPGSPQTPRGDAPPRPGPSVWPTTSSDSNAPQSMAQEAEPMASPTIPGFFRKHVTSLPTRMAARLRRKREPKFACPQCDSDFTTKHNYERHVLAHEMRKPFSCLCGGGFTTKSDLKRHQRNSKKKDCKDADKRERK